MEELNRLLDTHYAAKLIWQQQPRKLFGWHRKTAPQNYLQKCSKTMIKMAILKMSCYVWLDESNLQPNSE